ncbi:MAG TPA: cytochrome c maturation protein CcmE [Flavobacteriales bacterium]|nr:cytochrome c maturation protein CcmE [Flavobacteriales bacterium]
MKRSHIIALVIIAVAVAALIGSLNDSSSYASLTDAFSQPEREFHVVGTLDRSEPIVYEPSVNPSLTSFTMLDLEGRKCRVNLAMAKPTDLERSERVVLIGKAGTDGEFHAKDMLLKCPSKYNEENQVTAGI